MDANQPQLKNKHLLLIAAATGMVLMFFLVMAWQQFFAPVEIPQDGKYIRQRTELEAEANTLRHVAKALSDENEALLDTIQQLKKLPEEIHQSHETIRANNWHLPADRLRAEDTYRKRFQYHTYSN
jgi:hypothetical protein